MRGIISLVCGIIFGFGLTVASMTNPEKVLGFLNIFGAWDPSIDAFAVSASSKSLINDPILGLILVSIFAPFFCFLGYETTHRLAKVSHRSIYFAETIFFAGLAISVLSKHILN